jgi:DNA-binding winged helix-turn-helix (wHTH) protein
MKTLSIAVTFTLNGWTVRWDSCRLERSGVVVKVSPRAMDVLVSLAQRVGRVVSQDDLLHAFWRGGVSSPNAVHKCISELRRAFGDRRFEPGIIETVPKRGYRLLGSIEVIEATSADTVARQKVDRTHSTSANPLALLVADGNATVH